MTDARGTVWEYNYDTRGNLTSVSNPLQETTFFRYDAAGMLVETEDALQQVTRYDYDVNQRLSQIRTASGVTSFAYNAEGWLERISDPEQRQTRYGYDGRGRRTSIIDGANNEIRIEYDEASGGSSCSSCSSGRGASQPSRLIYPNGAETRFRYDIRGRTIAKTTIADGETLTTTFDYDPVGRLVSSTGPDGQTVSYSYDLLNRVTGVADVSGQTGYEYDLRGNLLTLTDAKSQTTRFEYDKNGRLTMERRPLGQETTYAYDAVGNLVEKREPNGNVTSYSYNDAGRLIAINAGNATESLQTSFTYTPTGQLQSYDDDTTSATYEYDALGRKTKETVNYGTFTKSFSYSYYANGLKKSFTMPDGTSYDYAYGDNNELRTIQIPSLGSISVPSYTWNSPDSLLFPGGSTQEFTYDPLQRLQRIQAKDPGSNSVLDFSYEYDTLGNIQQKVTEQGTYTYSYDAVQRLTNVDVDVPGLDDESFSYDAVGNRQSASNVSGDILHNANNELERYGDLEYAHDANGNLTEVTLNDVLLFEYTYNANNRLVKVEGGNDNTIAEYYYDPFGRRLWKEVGGTRSYFFYSDEGLVGEYDANGIELKTYGYRPNSTWTTDPLWLKHGTEYYFYQNDHLGTPQKLTAVNGAVVWSTQYTAFGKASIEVETVENNLRFPGQYFDAETGLHYNYQRYYDPEKGRYLKVDPIGFEGGDENLYAYVGSNVVNWIDPIGLELLVCSRRTRHPVLSRLGTIHAYLYDSDTRKYIGMGEPQEDPTEDACHIVGDPDNIDEILDYVKVRQGEGKRFPVIGNWLPFFNDCQTVISDTLEHFELPNPGIPGGRWGDTGMKGAWILELEILLFVEEQLQRIGDTLQEEHQQRPRE